MNWNNNDTKYILKRFIIYILIATAMFIIGTWRAKAATVGPDLLQFYNSSTTFFTRNTITQNKFGQNFYVSSTPSTISEVRAIYGISNNKISGSILSFSLQAGQPKPTISAQVQLVDGSFVNCDMETNTKDYADGTIYTAKCNIGTPQAVYKYGFMWQDSAGYNTSEGALLLTSINAFNSETDYTSYYNQLNSSINAASSQAHQDAQQAHQDAQQAHQDAQQINDSINNDNITTSDADDFTSNQAFSDSTGLESVIQLPLNMINSLTNTCQPIQITIPFIDYTGEIPCMSTIYRSKFNTLYTIVKLIINGFFIYRLLLKIYELVHNAKQPDEDKLEVIEL